MGVVEQVTLTDAANEAWARKAKLEADAAVQSLETQIFRYFKRRRGTYEVDPAMFDEFEPPRAVGAVVDGVTFALKEQHVAAVIWKCDESNCPERILRAVKDLVSLGAALALGAQIAEQQPKCERHSKRRGK